MFVCFLTRFGNSEFSYEPFAKTTQINIGEAHSLVGSPEEEEHILAVEGILVVVGHSLVGVHSLVGEDTLVDVEEHIPVGGHILVVVVHSPVVEGHILASVVRLLQTEVVP
eukprot:m.37743 g.37743  ORF g.37743 m.37743 type:complete len:111 (-) comp9344_c0_seq2:723-1055(-)